ncbi:MAG: proline--tRNA ligase [Actinomycetota bacterium]
MDLPKQAEDFPAWYQEVVKAADLAESSLVRGSMVIKPYGYAIWEAIQSGLDRRIKATGHQNVYFPMFIPYKLLEKETEHVEGFIPQVAIVTHAGGEKLEEPLVVRPTSETIIWATYAKWIQSYRDLPLLYNQWANVVRWEMRTRLFLRTTEFLWQEGHTAHETGDEAMRETLLVLNDVYKAAVEEDFAMPVITGRKTASERFPGAQETYSIEAMMRDGKALQAGTSHYFGQNFSKAYEVRFQGRDGQQEFPYSSSWGASTRLIGGLIMTHGDDKGLRLPPKLAPVQVVIIPIYRGDEDKARVLKACNEISTDLDGVRVKIDDRDQYRPGYKFNEWELKGVPLRVELGPRDLEAGQVTVARRDSGEKLALGLASLSTEIPRLLDQIQRGLYEQAKAFMDSSTVDPSSYDEMREFLSNHKGFARSLWCGQESCEAKVKQDAKATIRSVPIVQEKVDGSCLVCGQPATDKAVWAQSY